MSQLPCIMEPAAGDPAELAGFAAERRVAILDRLAEHGAVLLRGLSGGGADALARVAHALRLGLMEYQDRAAHRTRIAGRVFSAADYPPSHELFLHNEATYALRFPATLLLHCIHPADEGGATPIADASRIASRLPPAILRAFAARGVRYVRNFGGGSFGPSWQDAFQTEDRAELEQYCRDAGIELSWQGGERLRTRQTRPALIRHPRTRQLVWFNHAAALHVTTLPPRVRRSVLALFDDESYPCNTYYGDGGAIEAAELDAIRAAYLGEARVFDWRAGDLLLLDNLRVAHGRHAYRGRREMVVGLAEPTDWTQVESVGADDLGPG
jgi:alpha-ketoglutarate-dependent taurine dioxygenase